MRKSKYYFLTIQLVLFALIIFIFLPSCGNKAVSTKKAPGYLSNIDTRLHTNRPGHRIADRTETPIEGDSTITQNEEEQHIRIEDISIQEQRSIGGPLTATLKLIVDEEETEIDLFGIIDSDGTVDLRPIGRGNLVHGVATCIDKEFCHQIVLDIYYRTETGTLKRHQVQSVTPEVQVIENIDIQDPSIDNSNDQQEPSPQIDSPKTEEETPVIDTPKKEPLIVNVPPDIPEGAVEEPLSVIITRPPFDLDAIYKLPLPTPSRIERQRMDTAIIRERLEEGEDITSIQADLPEPTNQTPLEADETDPKSAEFTPTISPDDEVREAMGIAPSQFKDDYLNQNGSMENAIRRQAINRRSSGTLQEGERLIQDVFGIKWLQHGDSHIKWVTSMTNHFIRIVGSEYQRQHPQHFVIINRSSKQYGGRVSPHKTHQNGLDLDVAYPHADRHMQRFWNVFNGNGQFIMTEKDAEKTMDLLKTMSATDVINKYHVDQSVKDYLTHIAETTGQLEEQCPILTQLCHASGHRNHIHVQLKCTQFNEGCHDSADPPYSTCPTPRACQGI